MTERVGRYRQESCKTFARRLVERHPLTCVFLGGIQGVDPHGEALHRDHLAPLDLVQDVGGNVLAPGDLVLHVVVFLTVDLQKQPERLGLGRPNFDVPSLLVNPALILDHII